MNNHKGDKSKNALKSRKHFHSTKEKKRGARRTITKPHETEEDAMIRRFHDAQRMARFRARKKKAMEEAKALRTTDFRELSVIAELKRRNAMFDIGNSVVTVSNVEQSQTHWPVQNPSAVAQQSCKQSKYSQLLEIIEKLGKDIKLSYAGSRTSVERVKVAIVQARTLIKEILLETEINMRQ